MLLTGMLTALVSTGAVQPVPPPISADMIAVPPAAMETSPGDDPSQTLATSVDAAERMTVNVFVNGRGPYPFAIDTGADRTSIARSLSDRLALPTGGAAMVHSMGGANTINTAVISTLRVGTNEVRDIRAPVLDDQHVGVSGLLGIDGLANQRVEMDFDAGEMKIFPSRVHTEVLSEPGTITVTARRKAGQLILVDAEVDGEKVDVILDSGAQMSIGNDALRRKLTRKGKQAAIRPIVLLDVAGREIIAEMGVLPRMRVGGLWIEGLSIAWADTHPFRLFGLTRRPAMLLGMDVLRTFERVSVDFGNRKVRFLMRESGRRGLALDDGGEGPPLVKDVAG